VAVEEEASFSELVCPLIVDFWEPEIFVTTSLIVCLVVPLASFSFLLSGGIRHVKTRQSFLKLLFFNTWWFIFATSSVASKPYISDVNQSSFQHLHMYVSNFSFCTVILHNSMDYGYYPLWKFLKKKENQLHEVVHLFFSSWFQNKMQHVNYGFLSLWKFVHFFLYEYTKVRVEHTPTNH
jgi:hypothetical protein